MKRFQHIATLLVAGLSVTSCDVGSSDPTPEDVGRIFSSKILNLTCTAAQGKPGRVCSYNYDDSRETMTRRFLKREDGWHAVEN